MSFWFSASIALFFIGVLMSSAAWVLFRVRAVMNRRAWNGGVLPLLVVGLIVTAAGMLAIWATYPF